MDCARQCMCDNELADYRHVHAHNHGITGMYVYHLFLHWHVYSLHKLAYEIYRDF